MPAAVGFSLGLGRQPVISLVGDGAAMYSPQALWTAANEDLPVTFIVINNREYNVLKNFMRSQPHYLSAQTGQFIGMDIADPPIDFQSLSRAMGVPAKAAGKRERDPRCRERSDCVVPAEPARDRRRPRMSLLPQTLLLRENDGWR